jgi:hypothetical protein
MGYKGYRQSESTTPYCCRNRLVTALGANGFGPSLVRRSSEVSLVLEVRLTVGTGGARTDSVATAGLQPPHVMESRQAC